MMYVTVCGKKQQSVRTVHLHQCNVHALTKTAARQYGPVPSAIREVRKCAFSCL